MDLSVYTLSNPIGLRFLQEVNMKKRAVKNCDCWPVHQKLRLG